MKYIFLSFLLLFSIITVKAQSFYDGWDYGSYYKSDGNKVDGMIYRRPNGHGPDKNERYILFKTDSDAKKQWIPLSTLTSFIIVSVTDISKIDSFTVSISPFANYGYVKVALNTPIKIYAVSKYHSRAPIMMGGGMMIGGGGYEDDVYYFGEDSNSLTEITRKIYFETMIKIMAAKPKIVEAIKNKDFRFGRLEDLIEYYKTGIKPPPDY